MDTLYRYRAVDRTGAHSNGQLRANSQAAAIRDLMDRGLTPVAVEAASSAAAVNSAALPGRDASVTGLGIRGSASRRDLQLFVQELATLLKAGISLSEGLPTLAQAHAKLPLGQMLALADKRLRAGSELSLALDQSGIDWPAYVLPLVKAGEASGEMAQALAEAAVQMDHEIKVSQELRNALVYPAVLVLAGLLAILIIFVGVVPRFAGMLKSSKAEIPEISRWVIEAGTWLQAHLTGAGVTAGFVGILLWALLAQPFVRAASLDILSRWPVIGPWLRSVDLGRWALVLGALLMNRVPIIEALQLSSGALRLRSLREDLTRVLPMLSQGQSLSDLLEQQVWFPPVRLSLIRVGERSGQLPAMLQSLGELETQSARTLQKRVLALIEPAAILIIGTVIGFIMVAVMMAITSLNTAVV